MTDSKHCCFSSQENCAKASTMEYVNKTRLQLTAAIRQAQRKTRSPPEAEAEEPQQSSQ